MLARGTPEWLPYTALLPLFSIIIEMYTGPVWAMVALSVLLLPPLLSLYFFRDPERSVGGGVVSPADGKVLEVKKQEGKIFFSIYMGPLDVHVNRCPVDGKVLRIRHISGAHKLAFSKDSPHNERVIWTIKSSLGEIELIQIAGAFARRIRPYCKEGDQLRKGERIGLIRFGSRVDLSLPDLPGLNVRVSRGDKVKAASSTLIEVRRS